MSSSRCIVLALQQPAELLRDDGRWGNFRSEDFRRALAFYDEHVRARLGAAHDQHADLERLGRVRQAACSRSTSPGRGTSPSSRSACRRDLQDAWMTAPMPGPDGPGRSSAGGASLVIFRSLATQGGGLGAAEYLSRPARSAALLRAHRRHAAAAPTWQSPALAESPYARRSGAARSRALAAEGAGVGAHRARRWAHGGARRARRRQRR